jgi:transposase-like protein
MDRDRPVLLRGRHFADEIVILCVRWHLEYSLSYRDLTEMDDAWAEAVKIKTGQRIVANG